MRRLQDELAVDSLLVGFSSLSIAPSDERLQYRSIHKKRGYRCKTIRLIFCSKETAEPQATNLVNLYRNS